MSLFFVCKCYILKKKLHFFKYIHACIYTHIHIHTHILANNKNCQTLHHPWCGFIWANTLRIVHDVILFEQSHSEKMLSRNRKFWHFSFSPCNVEDTVLFISALSSANALIIAADIWQCVALCILQLILIGIWETVSSLIHTFVQHFHVLLYPE